MQIRRIRGQSLVEFALTLPVLLTLLLAIVELSYYYFTSISVSHAARAGIRLAAMNTASQDEIRREVLAHATGVLLGASDVQLTTAAHDATMPGNPPSVSIRIEREHRFFSTGFLTTRTLPVVSTFKSLVTTYAGRETITF